MTRTEHQSGPILDLIVQGLDAAGTPIDAEYIAAALADAQVRLGILTPADPGIIRREEAKPFHFKPAGDVLHGGVGRLAVVI